MAWIVKMRKKTSPLPMVRDWSECAGSYTEDRDEVVTTQQWWEEYDRFYSLVGWEYQIAETKQRKAGGK